MLGRRERSPDDRPTDLLDEGARNEIERGERRGRVLVVDDEEGVRMVPRAPAASFNSGPCLLFPRQAQFHPLAYLNALAGAIRDTPGTTLGTSISAPWTMTTSARGLSGDSM